MNKCKYEDLIDGYLLNKISEEKREEFEEHYFNCSICFEKMRERDELITAVKQKPDIIFHDLSLDEREEILPLHERIYAFLSPKQWAMAAVTAALILVIAIGVVPFLKTESPEFFLDDSQVRGKSITLISDAIPAQFKWESLGEGLEYKIYIYNHDLLWEETTKTNFISLPDEIKDKMIPGIKYFWQVKAFSPTGTLLAESSKVQLPITK